MASLVWSGLSELKADLRNLPHELAGEANHIVQAAANRAEADARAAYPVRTGNLRDGMQQQVTDESEFGVSIRVKNTAHHAWIFEYGTQARHHGLKTWGPMPAGNVFVPAMEKNRRWMYDELTLMLLRHGLGVQGDARAA